MPFSSVEYLILQDLQTIGRAAGLTGLVDADHRIRELPKVDQELASDTLPCVIYCPHAAIHSDPMSFEGDSLRVYVENVCLIAGHEGDFESNQNKVMTWHEQLYRAIEKESTGANAGQFRTTLPNVSSVWSIEIESAPYMDLSKLNQQYVYMPIIVRVRSAE